MRVEQRSDPSAAANATCEHNQTQQYSDSNHQITVAEIHNPSQVVGIFPALATLFLAPDVVGIVIVNAPVDAFILMDWWSCICADRLLGLRLLGQV